MVVNGEITEIHGPSELRVNDMVTISIIVKNNGDTSGYIGILGFYSDGGIIKEVSVTPKRVLMSSDSNSRFSITFPMPNSDVDVSLQAIHWELGKTHQDSTKIHHIILSQKKRSIIIKTGNHQENEKTMQDITPKLKKIEPQIDHLQKEREIILNFRQITNQRYWDETGAIKNRENRLNDIKKRHSEAENNFRNNLHEFIEIKNSIKIGLNDLNLDYLLQDSPIERNINYDNQEADDITKNIALISGINTDINKIFAKVANWQKFEHKKRMLDSALVFLLLSICSLGILILGAYWESSPVFFMGWISGSICIILAEYHWDFKNNKVNDNFSVDYKKLFLLLILGFLPPIYALYYIITSVLPSYQKLDEQNHHLMPENKATQQLKSLVPKMIQLIAETENFINSALKVAEIEYSQELEQIETEYQSNQEQIQSQYESKWNQIDKDCMDLTRGLALNGLSFKNSLWNSWVPTNYYRDSKFIRIGQLIESTRWGNITLPALLPIFNEKNIIIDTCGSAKDQAIEAIQCLMLRLLTIVQPGKLRFIFIDPVGLGQNLAMFMELGDYEESLTGGKIWTKPQHIEEQLTRITEHMELIIQKYLRNKYINIEQYNAEAGEVAEPYRFLIILNFPINFTESAVNSLRSIAINGPRCGVYTILMIDNDRKSSLTM